MKRVFLIVLDSFGIGEAPDAATFGDAGSNTLRSVSSSERFNIKNLKRPRNSRSFLFTFFNNNVTYM